MARRDREDADERAARLDLLIDDAEESADNGTFFECDSEGAKLVYVALKAYRSWQRRVSI